MKKLLFLCSGSLVGLPLSVWAAANSASLPAAAPSSAGSLLQVLFALALVLGLIVAAAWLMRRFSLVPGGAGGQLRVVSGVMVGPRERVVIVEIQQSWLVLGVTSGQVNLLHTLDKPEGVVTPTPAAPAFAQWLQTAIEKRKVGK
ncbi:flagellar biosynthetic protein FliO [Chitinibacter bivalviorum]|uniref:Flagellar protein n=1 Tax=Chitinibacter bivalviorum TaxID=2739434 RepID=A0A7H9BDL1_9NEIS|nr:flagellar biosynthetic protein FliO [Chitinibacter bivalviorum]QLG86793.1 flagellar biosynthetic protein FliO [Chitinibacter bivalviorum]